MLRFTYHPDITTQFPNLHAAVILAQGLSNSPSSQKLKASFRDEQHAVLDRLGDTPLSQVESLAAWRAHAKIEASSRLHAHECVCRAAFSQAMGSAGAAAGSHADLGTLATTG